VRVQLRTLSGFLFDPTADPISEMAEPKSLLLLVGAALLMVPVPPRLLLLSMWVKMSFVYLSLFVISALFDSSAWFRGKVDLSPFLFT
jgi:membrane protein implicated in regulation of membrane protease activity